MVEVEIDLVTAFLEREEVFLSSGEEGVVEEVARNFVFEDEASISSKSFFRGAGLVSSSSC